MKNVALIGSVGLPANYGGFETLANHLVKNLGDKYQFTVYCSSKKYKKSERMKTFHGAKLKYIPLNANGIQSIAYDSLSILHALFHADVLLVLGVAGAWMLPFVRLFTRKKIIISIDGIEWKRDKWSPLAKMYLWWAENLAVKYSHIDISDNESIQDYTALRYKSLSRIVEYGGDHVDYVRATDEDKIRYPFLHHTYAVKVCRIEPENNVEMVLKAFREMDKQVLVIIGNWDTNEYGQQLKKEYAEIEHIILLDPIYDQRTLDLIRSNASLYVHGHSAGGTNPSLVEAMSLTLPVLSFNVSYNRTTTENKAHYFNSPHEIIDFVKNASSQALYINKHTMKGIANRRYKWEIIAQKYDALIHEALSVKSKTAVLPELNLAYDHNALVNEQVGHLQYQHAFYEK